MARNFQRPTGARKQLQKQDVQGLVALLQHGNHKQAEAKARKLAKKFPSAPVLLDILSKALLGQEKFVEASKVLEKLIVVKPDHYDGYYNLGLVYMNMGKPELAIERFRYVIEKAGGSADAYTNLGAAFFELERYAEAAENYEKAVELNPEFAPALRNLGASLRMINRLEESEKYLEKLPFLKPGFAPGHLSLGVTQRLLGKTEKAKKSFETSLALEPDNREAHNELGNLHYTAGEYGESIRYFEKVDTKISRAQILEAMHQDGADHSLLLDRLSELNSQDPLNLRAAAFSAFASQQYGVEDTHTFAPNPLDYVSVKFLDDVLADDPEFLQRLMNGAGSLTSAWENHTTRGGYQSFGNLFDEGEVFAKLETIIRSELKRYRKEKSQLSGEIVRQFPKHYELDGWHVKLLKSGHQKPHIHSRGWVSGVIYLKVPEKMPGDEGAISFSLHGYDYRKLDENIPELIHQPKAGELVFFPSSLFHSTVPFETDEDRQCIAFDMIPAESS